MSTDFRDLSYDQQLEIRREMAKYIPHNNKAEIKEFKTIVNNVMSGYCCAYCFMPYYNCLCSHED